MLISSKKRWRWWHLFKQQPWPWDIRRRSFQGEDIVIKATFEFTGGVWLADKLCVQGRIFVGDMRQWKRFFQSLTICQQGLKWSWETTLMTLGDDLDCGPWYFVCMCKFMFTLCELVLYCYTVGISISYVNICIQWYHLRHLCAIM